MEPRASFVLALLRRSQHMIHIIMKIERIFIAISVVICGLTSFQNSFASDSFQKREHPSRLTNADFLNLAKTLTPGSSFNKICQQKYRCVEDKKYNVYTIDKDGNTEIGLFFTPDKILYGATITVASKHPLKLKTEALKKSLIQYQKSRKKTNVVDYHWRDHYETGNEADFGKSDPFTPEKIFYSENNYFSEIDSFELSKNSFSGPLYSFTWSFEDWGKIWDNTLKNINNQRNKLRIPISNTFLYLDKDTISNLQYQTNLRCQQRPQKNDFSKLVTHHCYINNNRVLGVVTDQNGVMHSLFTFSSSKLSEIKSDWLSFNPSLTFHDETTMIFGPKVRYSCGLYGTIEAVTLSLNRNSETNYETFADGNAVIKNRDKTYKNFLIAQKKVQWLKTNKHK